MNKATGATRRELRLALLSAGIGFALQVSAAPNPNPLPDPNPLPTPSGPDAPTPDIPALVAIPVVPALDPQQAAQQLVDSTPQRLYLSVRVNEMPVGGLFPFTVMGDTILADRATLIGLGFKDSAVPAQAADIDLRSLGLVEFNRAEQTLSLRTTIDRLDRETTQLGSELLQRAAVPTPTLRGLMMNYRVAASQMGGGKTQLAGEYALSAMGLGSARLESRGILRNTDNGSTHHETHVRLDSRFVMDWDTVRLEVGDLLGGGDLNWTRAVRMGGIRVGTRYRELQPWRRLAPLPGYNGSAVLPSTVELMLDGTRQLTREIAPGPFSLSALPSREGQGNATVVLTDLLGQRQEVDLSFYYNPDLLQAGLSDWSVSAGVLRRNFGMRSNDYGDQVAVAGSLRRGLTPWLTAEGNAEYSPLHRQLGGGLSMALPGFGGVQVAAAASNGDLGAGHMTLVGYQWADATKRWGARWQRNSEQFADIGRLEYGQVPLKQNLNAYAGVQLSPRSYLGVNYAAIERFAATSGIGNNPAPRPTFAERERMLGLNWNLSFGRGASVFVQLNRQLDGERDTSGFLGLTVPLGRPNLYAGRSVRVNQGRTQVEARLDRYESGSHGLSWQLAAGGGDDGPSARARMAYQLDTVRLEMDAQRQNGFDLYNATATGSVLWAGGSLFAARQTWDGMALVDVGLPGIPVMANNQPVGVTGRSGKILVSQLASMTPNRITLDTSQLPANVAVTQPSIDAVPRPGSATRIRFGLKPQRSVVLTVVDARGEPLPVGSLLTWTDGAPVSAADDQLLPVGMDGQVYIPDLPKRTANARIDLPQGGQCRVSVPDVSDPIPTQLPPITCTPETPKQ